METQPTIKVELLDPSSMHRYTARIEKLLRAELPCDQAVHTESIRHTFLGQACIFGAFVATRPGLVGVAVGTVKQTFSGRTFLVDDVVVDQACHRVGVGRALMVRIEQYAQMERCTTLELTSVRLGTGEFYTKLGCLPRARASFQKVLKLPLEMLFLESSWRAP